MTLILSDVALTTIICTYIFVLIALLSLAIHLYVCLRIRQCRRFSLEDYFAFIAFIPTLGITGQITWAVVNEGQGQHMPDITQSQLDLIGKVCYRMNTNKNVMSC